MTAAKLMEFENELKGLVKGTVSFDEVTRGIYATDASIYQLMPVAVVEPKDEDDVRAAVRAAAKYNVSILPRGGGTSLNGQGCGRAMILDFTKYMNQILELNVEERWVRVQPGIVLDVLNALLAEYGLQFAPDPATSSRATIGGMMGNNSAGTKSLLFGMTRDHVIESKVLLSDGTVLRLRELSSDEYNEKANATENNAREREIYRNFKNIIEDNRNEIDKAYPKVMRRVQGYNLDLFTSTDRWNLTKLIIGSEGTLGIFLESTLKLVPMPKSKILCTVHFSDLLEAIRTVSPILERTPSAVEIMDEDIVIRARENLSIRPLTQFVEGDPKAILIVEFFGESEEEALQRAEHMVKDLQKHKLGYAWPIITEPGEQAKVWSVRKNGLGLMLGMKGDRKPLPIVEDGCVPIAVLPEYIDKMLKFCRRRGIPVAMYAHASVGVIHVRPALSLKSQEDIEHMKAIAEYACTLIKQYGGSMSGEHGDGRVRSPFLEGFFGKEVYDLFREVKELFDPSGLMNPGIIVDPNPIDQDLRYGVAYSTPDLSPEYHYREDGSFAASVEMCTGVGDCRQRLSGTMCPSYRVTLDEKHSTRGYANALRLAMTGQLGTDGMIRERLYEIMDFCISCKACKSECPSNVDLARLKSEFLQFYHDAHGVPRGAQFIVNYMDRASCVSGPIAHLVNVLLRSWPGRKLLAQFKGIDARRRLPAYTVKNLSRWFAERSGVGDRTNRRVVLFNDTYMNSFQPDIGRSAVELLESCGYEVTLANAGCCQRHRISKGILGEAKARGERTLRNLDSYIQQGLQIVVCEPGCCSALVDDLPDLIDDVELGNRIRANVKMIDSFLAQEYQRGNIGANFISPYSNILIQGHCHQKALFGITSMKYLLDLVPGMRVEELDAGCCGMGDLYGYEKVHYDYSMQIGEDRLFPLIRNREDGATVVACGFLCRTQIADGTGVKPVHWVETIRGIHKNL
jgi:FAD/FMN-containing dehydrogenase/Fe-S oxidoreductase